MEYSIHDSVRKLATKLGADSNGANIENTLNNIAVKLGGKPTTNRGIAGAIDAITKVADIDDMHNMTTLNVTPTSEAQTIIPESPVDGYSQVNVAAAPSADLITKTYEVPIPYYVGARIKASDDNADGYYQVTLTGPSQQEIEANWYPVTLTVNGSNEVTVSNTFEADLTAAYRAGKTFYIDIQQEI